MQAPGGPEEDPSDGFQYGGWTAPYFDEPLGTTMVHQLGVPFDLLLGRKTYDIFAAYWPNQPEHEISNPLNAATKYVVSTKKLDLSWKTSVQIDGDVVAALRDLKQTDGPMLQVHGSSVLIQTLLEHDLVDELWLKIFPVTLGSGKRLFGSGTIPAAFQLAESSASPSGVLVANYTRAGDLKVGTVG